MNEWAKQLILTERARKLAERSCSISIGDLGVWWNYPELLQCLFFRSGSPFGSSFSRGSVDPHDESVQGWVETVPISLLTATGFLPASLCCPKGLRASLSFASSLVWYNEIPLLD